MPAPDFGLGYAIGLQGKTDFPQIRAAEAAKASARAKKDDEDKKERQKLLDDINQYVDTQKLGLHRDVDPAFRKEVINPAISRLYEKYRSGNLGWTDTFEFKNSIQSQLAKYKALSEAGNAFDKDLQSGKITLSPQEIQNYGTGDYKKWANLDPVSSGFFQTNPQDPMSFVYRPSGDYNYNQEYTTAINQRLKGAQGTVWNPKANGGQGGYEMQLVSGPYGNKFRRQELRPDEEKEVFQQTVWLNPNGRENFIQDQYKAGNLTQSEAVTLKYFPERFATLPADDPLVEKISRLSQDYIRTKHAFNDERIGPPPPRTGININTAQTVGGGESNLFRLGNQKGGFVSARPGPQVQALSLPADPESVQSVPVQNYIDATAAPVGKTGAVIKTAENVKLTPSTITYFGVSKTPIKIEGIANYPAGTILTNEIMQEIADNGYEVPPNSLVWQPFAIGDGEFKTGSTSTKKSIYVPIDDKLNALLETQFQKFGYRPLPPPSENVYEYYGITPTTPEAPVQETPKVGVGASGVKWQ